MGRGLDGSFLNRSLRLLDGCAAFRARQGLSPTARLRAAGTRSRTSGASEREVSTIRWHWHGGNTSSHSEQRS